MPDRIETEAFRDAGISQVLPDDCYQRAADKPLILAVGGEGR